MSVERIESLKDPRIAHYRDLPSSNLIRQSGLFIVEGWLLVERLLASPFQVESLLVDGRHVERLPADVLERVPVYVTPPGLVESIIGFNFHRGVLGCGRRSLGPRLGELVNAGTDPVTVVVCVDVQDPTNLGGILRSCAAFGVGAVLVGRRCADPYSRRVLRVSMGAVLQHPPVESSCLQDDLLQLRDGHRFSLAAAVVGNDAEPLHQVPRTPRLALLFGNEGCGLPPEIVGLCQRRVTIPMCGNTDSLNVAVAAGVFLYHFTRVAATRASRNEDASVEEGPASAPA
jgi:tRNA G18 (ribose-2'-O)-methylase SpoU